MKIHMLGNKLGMTQIFNEEGKVIPVTALKVGPCFVVDKKTDEKDGYNALVLGYEDVKESRTRKSELGFFKKAKVTPKKILGESRGSKEDLAAFQIGQTIGVDIFKKNDRVDVSGKSKGRGFTGVMKRHGMAGAKGSHGTHEHFRHGGSIGSNTFPGRVWKGMKMPGRYGWSKVTVQSLTVADVKPEHNILLVKGAVPGPNKGYVSVTSAVKSPLSKKG
jgi:large subunit ribosomal protein L3